MNNYKQLPGRVKREIEKAGKLAADHFCAANGIDDPEFCPEHLLDEMYEFMNQAIEQKYERYMADEEDYFE